MITIHQRYVDGQTDGQTDRQLIMAVPRYYASRDKNAFGGRAPASRKVGKGRWGMEGETDRGAGRTGKVDRRRKGEPESPTLSLQCVDAHEGVLV